MKVSESELIKHLFLNFPLVKGQKAQFPAPQIENSLKLHLFQF